MIKQFLKIAGVKTEKDLLRKYGTEEAFFKAHPEAEMLVQAAMGGSYYQDGGSPLYSTQGQALRNFMNTVAYSGRNRFDEGGMASEEMDSEAAMVQQGPPPPNEGQGGQLEEIIKFIVQALQEGMAPEQVIAKLTEMGLPQEQAGELVQGVVQQLQAGQQEAPPQEMMQGQPPMGRYGGMYANGGEPCPDINMIKDEEGRCVCKPGYEADQMTGECYPVGAESPDDENMSDGPVATVPPSGGGSGSVGMGNIPRGSFTAGLGLKGKNYNFDYGFNVGSDFKTGVEHTAKLGFPNLFTIGKNKGGLDLTGRYNVGKMWNAGVGAGIPLTGAEKGSILKFTGNVGQMFNDPELRNTLGVTEPSDNRGMMTIAAKKNPINYQAGVEYLGKLLGEKGPDVKISANYGNRQYGGLSKFVNGGAPQQGGEQAQQQQLMQQVAQMLQQGAQPEQVMQQLVQMGMPQEQAQQLIQMIMQQMQGASQEQAAMRMGGTPCYNCGGSYADGGSADTDNGTYYQGMYMAYGGPYIPLYTGGGDNNYGKGGSVKKYKKGGEYEMSENEVQDLINKGYKIQYL